VRKSRHFADRETRRLAISRRAIFWVVGHHGGPVQRVWLLVGAVAQGRAPKTGFGANVAVGWGGDLGSSVV